jgi:hypothetical protein
VLLLLVLLLLVLRCRAQLSLRRQNDFPNSAPRLVALESTPLLANLIIID